MYRTGNYRNNHYYLIVAFGSCKSNGTHGSNGNIARTRGNTETANATYSVTDQLAWKENGSKYTLPREVDTLKEYN